MRVTSHLAPRAVMPYQLLKTISNVNLSFKFKTNKRSQARNCFWASCLCCSVLSASAAHFACVLKILMVRHTLLKKNSLRSLQFDGMSWVIFLKSQMKYGNVLWKYSASSLRAAILGCPSLLERSLMRSDKFTIKLKICQGKPT